MDITWWYWILFFTTFVIPGMVLWFDDGTFERGAAGSTQKSDY